MQTRWTYLNKAFSILTQIERCCSMATLYWRGCRGSGLFFNFNGAAGVCAAA